MSKLKPTGYIITVEADVFYALIRTQGNTSQTQRREWFGISDELDHRLYGFWSRAQDKLKEDGNWYE